jgi:head-tail adaptor
VAGKAGAGMSKVGVYDRKVTLMYSSGAVNASTGEPIYSTGATVWAAWDVKPPSGRTIQVQNMENAVSTRWIKIRYISGIDSSWRVKYGTKKDSDGTIVPQLYEINQPPIDLNMQHRELYLELNAM